MFICKGLTVNDCCAHIYYHRKQTCKGNTL